jgi:hypothetical protein
MALPCCMHNRRQERRAPWWRCGLLIGVVLLAGGCYERVVDEDAPVHGRTEVYEPNLKDDRIPIVEDLEDAVFEGR